MKKFQTLFGGRLGKLDMEPIDIELIPGSKPYGGRYYKVPKTYEKVFKKYGAKTMEQLREEKAGTDDAKKEL